jgi:tetratricopeptide (TPR) repeat protein
MYLLHGAGIPARPRDPSPQGIRRVAATLLALLGLPPESSLAGPPLPPVPPSSLPPVDSSRRFREELRARGETRDSTPSAASSESPGEVEKLRSLGYLGGAEPDRVTPGIAGGRSPGSWNNEGVILRGEGRMAEARAAFEAAIALDARFASAEWNLSELLWQSGEVDRADELFRSALAHELGDGASRLAARVAARLARGRAALEASDCAAAAREFDRAAVLDPKNAAAPAAEGLARLCLGDEAAAAAAFRRSLAIEPGQPEIAAALRRLGGASH